jgi:PAS domain S-box-containing protein
MLPGEVPLPGERILIIEDNPEYVEFLLTNVLSPRGYLAQTTTNGEAGLNAVREERPDLVLLDLGLNDIAYTEMLQRLQVCGDPPVIVLTHPGAEAKALHAMRLGAHDALIYPLQEEESARVIARVLHRERLAGERDWLVRKLADSNEALEQSLFEAQTLYHVSKTISSSLNLQDVLTAVVHAATLITQAEEGYLLLSKLENDELYLRAIQSRGEARAIHCHVRAEDAIAHQVVNTGEPVTLSSKGDASIKIACKQALQRTDNLARSLVNVPLCEQGQVIGVLGVNNVLADENFDQSDVMLLSALAESATIAIRNAQAYTRINQTLSRVLSEVSTAQFKSEFIQRNISEGIYTVNQDLRITSVNPAMEYITGWRESELLGRRYDEVFNPQTGGSRLGAEQTVPGKALHSQAPVISTQSTILRRDNRRITVAGTAAPLRNSGLSEPCVLGTMRDMTPEIQLSQLRRKMQPISQSDQLRFDRLSEETLHTLHREIDTTAAQCHPVTLKPIIKQVVKNFQKAIPNSSFQVTLAPDLPFAVGNESRIELALVNLIDIALLLDAPEGPVRISAKAKDNFVVVAVAGPGPADPTEEYRQVFYAQHSADEPNTLIGNRFPWCTMPQIKWYIASELIQAQGGQVWIENRSGTSIRFHFSLPRIEEQDVAQALVN